MIFIHYILFFVIGVICAQWITPLLDSLFSLWITALEEKKGKIAVRIAALQMQMEGPQENSPAIGFEWFPETEMAEEEEGEPEEEDD